jgi:hypothetical protein
MNGKDYEDEFEYTWAGHDGRPTYMQGEGECDMDDSQKPCDILGCSEDGQLLESFEDGIDFELIDDRGRTIEHGENFRICREHLTESHDSHWYATHPEFLGFSEPAED